MQATLKKIEKRLSQFEDGLLVLLLLGIIFTSVAQIVMRNFFSSSLSWADGGLKMAVLWLTLVGSVVAARENRHLNIDVLSKFLPKAISDVLNRLMQFIAAIVCVILVKYSIEFVMLAVEFEDKFLNEYPLWIFQSILPIGFGLMALRFSLNAIRSQPEQEMLGNITLHDDEAIRDQEGIE